MICQRPYFTGSGINLINLTNNTAEKRIEQFLIFGQPVDNGYPLKVIIDEKYVNWVKFQSDDSSIKCDVNFPVAGMSDQMPYFSSKFSDFTLEMLESYLHAFAEKLKIAIEQFQPNIIHSHHLWLVSALCRALFPKIPMVTSCHNTGLRQIVLAEHLKKFVINPIKDIDIIAVQSEEQKQGIIKSYNFEKFDNFHIIGQGINTDLFHPLKQKPEKKSYSIIYVGKLNNSKGVPQLIQAYKEVLKEIDLDLRLYLAGSGIGDEKDEIVKMASSLEDKICFLGQVNQEDLAEYLRKSDIFILPSFYDSIPKVLLESLASGCRAIITDLPGIQETITRCCGENDVVQYIDRPKMESIDKPLKEELPNFINGIKQKLKLQLSYINNDVRIESFSEKVRKIFSQDVLFEKFLKIYNSFTL
ncbi:MAG: glycosyltransferase family 4 protein [Promethearchaeota archaeon]